MENDHLPKAPLENIQQKAFLSRINEDYPYCACRTRLLSWFIYGNYCYSRKHQEDGLRS